MTRREQIDGRLQGEAERRRGQEEHQYEPGQGPQPAPTAGVQDAAFPQLNRDAPAVGDGGGQGQRR